MKRIEDALRAHGFKGEALENLALEWEQVGFTVGQALRWINIGHVYHPGDAARHEDCRLAPEDFTDPGR